MRPATMFLLVLPAHVAQLGAADALAQQNRTPPRQLDGDDGNPQTHFLVVGKAMPGDHRKLQEKAVFSVRKVADAVGKPRPGIVVDQLAERVMTKQQYWRGEAREKVTGAIFRERLKRLATATTPQDTVVVYTHSHGRKNGFRESQPLGGIVIEVPINRPENRGMLFWDEYTDLLLEIPAKNVVVLTMSCFSGGLVEHFNSPSVKARWEERRSREGRNLIVLTSQNKDLMSPPIVKDGEVINPFTYAMAKMLSGEADGFCLMDGRLTSPRHEDGKLTVGEMIDFILYTTANTVSEQPRLKNIAKPQVTGSFDRADVLSFGAKAPGDHPESK